MCSLAQFTSAPPRTSRLPHQKGTREAAFLVWFSCYPRPHQVLRYSHYYIIVSSQCSLRYLESLPKLSCSISVRSDDKDVVETLMYTYVYDYGESVDYTLYDTGI